MSETRLLLSVVPVHALVVLVMYEPDPEILRDCPRV